MNSSHRSLITTCVIGCLAFTSLAHADEIVFRNGDKLSGKITGAEGGKITIEETVAGRVTVDAEKVQTFTTDAPVTIRLKDGSVLKQQVAASAEPGAIQTTGGTVAAQTVALTDVKDINHPIKWTCAILVGGELTRGNSDTENLDATADAVRRSDDDRITGGAGYSFGRQRDPATGNKSTTTDNWFLLGKYDYFFTPKFYGYGMTRIDHDNIANLDIRVAPSVGVGYQWVERPDFNFNTEGGVGWIYESYDPEGHDEHFIARLAYHVDKKLNDVVSVFHDLEYLPSLESINDFNINADAGVKTQLTTSMFAQFKFEWKHDETPAPGALENDLRYVLGVGWSF